jgi:hypothetical protein
MSLAAFWGELAAFLFRRNIMVCELIRLGLQRGAYYWLCESCNEGSQRLNILRFRP